MLAWAVGSLCWRNRASLPTADDKNQMMMMITIINNIISVGCLPVIISALFQSNKIQAVSLLPRDSPFCSRTKRVCPATTQGHRRRRLPWGEVGYLLPLAGVFKVWGISWGIGKSGREDLKMCCRVPLNRLTGVLCGASQDVVLTPTVCVSLRDPRVLPTGTESCSLLHFALVEVSAGFVLGLLAK